MRVGVAGGCRVSLLKFVVQGGTPYSTAPDLCANPSHRRHKPMAITPV